MLARVDGSKRRARVREGLHGDGLVGVVGRDVLKSFGWGEGRLVFVVSKQPYSRGLVVLVVADMDGGACQRDAPVTARGQAGERLT
jgi:hypothetical protein